MLQDLNHLKRYEEGVHALMCVCGCVIKAHWAVARWCAQISSCDGDVVEGCGLSVQLYVLPHPKLALHGGNHKFIWWSKREQRGSVVRKEVSNNHYLHKNKDLLLTLVVSTGDAVLYFAVKPRVFIAGSEGPDSGTRLAFCHFKRSLIVSGESRCYIVHI